jgi:flagellar assembly factor FliW
MPVTVSATATSETSLSDLNTNAVVFPDGLVGCDAWKRFVLITDDEVELPIARLQSLDDPDVAIIITTPTVVDPGYLALLTPEDRAELQLDDMTAPVMYCTLSVQPDGWLTANLLGPLVLNPTNRRGKQLVLAESTYSTRHPVAQLSQQDDAACSS